MVDCGEIVGFTGLVDVGRGVSSGSGVSAVGALATGVGEARPGLPNGITLVLVGTGWPGVNASVTVVGMPGGPGIGEVASEGVAGACADPPGTVRTGWVRWMRP